MRFLREVGEAALVNRFSSISAVQSSLILAGLLSRGTEDIDVVDEVPAAIRSQHELLSSLASRYGLHLAHFQSHYLPSGWQERVRSLGQFGNLAVRLIDAHDIFIGKLFSAREKDRDDLQLMSAALDKSRVAEHLKATAQTLLAEEPLCEHRQKKLVRPVWRATTCSTHRTKYCCKYCKYPCGPARFDCTATLSLIALKAASTSCRE